MDRLDHRMEFADAGSRVAPGGLVPVDLAAWLRARGISTAATSTVWPANGPSPGGGSGGPRGSAPADLLDRAAAYLARVPGAVSGQRGHDQTFYAACVLVKGFGLNIEQARQLLAEWNQRCEPPWSPLELEHKLKSAEAVADHRARGYLADRPGPGPTGRVPHRSPSGGTSPGVPCLPGRPVGALTKPQPQPGADLPFPVAIPTPSQSSALTGPHTGVPAAKEELSPATDPDLLVLEGYEANPHRLARLFLRDRFTFTGGIGLRFWREEFHQWDGSAYRRVAMGEIRAQLAQVLACEFERIDRSRPRLPAALAGEPGRSRRSSRARPIPVSSRLVGDVLEAVGGLVLLRAADTHSQPAWIEGFPGPVGGAPTGLSSGPPRWPVGELLPARNGLVHLSSLAGGTMTMVPATPCLFNAHALDYDFVPEASEPREWLAFLRQIWDDDEESIACLQEWFGYLLTPDTRHHKILMMVGPKRSGRGTIARVLKAMVGPRNVVNPTLAMLARPFGPASLVDKSVAVFPDARLSSPAGQRGHRRALALDQRRG